MSARRAVDVVVGLIGDSSGRWLVNCRPPGTPLAGSWEFPGGKRQPGEAPLAALKRELDEELGIEVLEAEPVLVLEHDYPDKRVYYLHSLSNCDVTGTNATCAQVAVGVDAALSTLKSERLAPRLYFPSDLYNTIFTDIVFSNLRVEQFVFEKREDSLQLKNHIANVRSAPAPVKEVIAA